MVFVLLIKRESLSCYISPSLSVSLSLLSFTPLSFVFIPSWNVDTILWSLTAILVLSGSNYENKMQHLSIAEHRDDTICIPEKIMETLYQLWTINFQTSQYVRKIKTYLRHNSQVSFCLQRKESWYTAFPYIM